MAAYVGAAAACVGEKRWPAHGSHGGSLCATAGSTVLLGGDSELRASIFWTSEEAGMASGIAKGILQSSLDPIFRDISLFLASQARIVKALEDALTTCRMLLHRKS